MIKLIIFDLDGLLIDSQPLQYKAYNQVFSKYGFPLTKNDWKEWIQNSYNPKEWIQKNNLPLEEDTIRAEKKKIYDKLIREELKLKPGAENLINKLYGKYKLCIASSSRIESIKLVVNKFNLESKFEKLISDTKMARRKPNPDVFLKAAKIMNIYPEECIVIEDSLAGLKAAKSAKMKCIICPDSFWKTDQSKFKPADKIVKTLNEVNEKMIEI
jgi:HAD superfamily hydrolase (TIGR01509 family)